MLSQPDEAQTAAVLAIANAIHPLSDTTFRPAVPLMQHQQVTAGRSLFTMEQNTSQEYFVLSGILRTYVLSPDGDEVTLSFAVGPAILPPAISRTIDGISQVSCDALVDASVVTIASDDLVTLMMGDVQVQQWGDAVMRGELIRRTKRELGLATKTGRDRLAQFRLEFPELESQVPHPMIASYLGITPVTLSRLRND